jgi:hypothetical protein
MNLYLFASIIIGITSLFITVYFLRFSKLFHGRVIKSSASNAGNYGEFISGLTGPLLSFAAILMIIATIEQDNKQNEIQHFEQNYYQLVEFHRQNINDLVLTSSLTKQEKKGRQAVLYIANQLKKCYKNLNLAYSLMFTHEQLLNLSFFIVYYGSDSIDIQMMSEKLIEKNPSMTPEFCKELISKATEPLFDNYDNQVYYQGHKSRLSHLIENYFLSLEYLSENRHLSNSEKTYYFQTIQSQNGIYLNTIISWYLRTELASNKHISLFNEFQSDDVTSELTNPAILEILDAEEKSLTINF